jgi:hypothetical protein
MRDGNKPASNIKDTAVVNHNPGSIGAHYASAVGICYRSGFDIKVFDKQQPLWRQGWGYVLVGAASAENFQTAGITKEAVYGVMRGERIWASRCR